MERDAGGPEAPMVQRGSDLVLVPFTIVLILAVLSVLAGFFLAGVVVGFIVLVVWIAIAIVVSARFLRRNEID